MKVTKMQQESTSTASDKLIEINHKTVNYRIDGPSKGPWVILVCGMVTPMFAWDFLAKDLASQGFRVLRYDHFGRGGSDRPSVFYRQEVFVRQLKNLIDKLNIHDNINLVGWSMGGMICSIFANRYPDKVDKLVLIAPALFLKIPLIARAGMYLPLFGWYMKKNTHKIMLKGLRKHFHEQDHFSKYYDMTLEQIKYPGFIESLISTLRHFPSESTYNFDTLGRHPRSVLLVWGDQDTITPYANHLKVQNVFLNSELFTVKGAGHAPHYEYSEMVNDQIIGFLQP